MHIGVLFLISVSLFEIIILSAYPFSVYDAIALYTDDRSHVHRINPSLNLVTITVANSNCLIINEIMYDPEGTPDSDHEWIELYNTCNETIDLTGWKISDNSSTDEIPSANVSPYGFVVIAAKAVFLDDYPDFYAINRSVVFINGSIGSGLNNDGDRISLTNSSGVIVDEMSYGKDKSVMSLPDVGDGCSLERLPAGGAFGENTNPTPGFGWQNATPTPASTPSPAPSPTFTPSLTVTPTFTPGDDTQPTPMPSLSPWPTLSPSPTPEPTPAVTPAPTDTPIQTPAPSSTATPPVSPTPTDTLTGTILQKGVLLINEILYDPTSAPDVDYEWIELYNTCNETIELVVCQISDNASTDVIPAVSIAAKGFTIIAAKPDFSSDYPDYCGNIAFINGSIGSGLNNDGDRITLRDSTGNVIDELSYGNDESITSLPDVAQGHSLERQPAGGGFIDNELPTPGYGLPAAMPTPSPTLLPSPTPVATPNQTPSPTVSCAPAPIVSPTTNSTGTIANRGDILINEVQYNPPQSGSDALYEWIELYSTYNETVTLIGWTITDNKEVDVIPMLNLSAHGLAIVAASANFSINFPDYNGTIVFTTDGRIGNGLGNEGDLLILKDSAGTAIDELSYGDDSNILPPPYPKVAEGHSLERTPCGGLFIDNEVPSPGNCLVGNNSMTSPPPTTSPDVIPISPESNLSDSAKINLDSPSNLLHPMNKRAHTSSSNRDSFESSGVSLWSLFFTLCTSLITILAWTLYREKVR